MNNFTERTWLAPLMGSELEKLMKTYIQYPPRKLQSDGYTGPITITGYERLESVKKQLENYKINLNPVP
jgi:arylsulfatase